MTGTMLHCGNDDARRAQVRGTDLNGIDSVEVDCAQTTLIVTFLGHAPSWIEPANIRIEGGRRERDIRVLAVAIEHAEDEGLDDRMFVTVDRPGDFSTYRLVIVARDERGHLTGETPPDFDSRYAAAEFSFKAGCPQDQDPADCPPCLPAASEAVAIDYLAKDYQGFLKLMLGRLALTMPDWQERHAPDIGVTLVELLAYVADDLSYYQDAIATEAFLDSARLRESVRRHCRLVDYRLHQGCSARAWAVLEIEGSATLDIDPGDMMLTTQLPGGLAPMLRGEAVEAIAEDAYLVFEPAAGVPMLTLRRARNRIDFYDWGGSECCLVAGATAATLWDRDDEVVDAPSEPTPEQPAENGAQPAKSALGLVPGDVLLFAEVIGPRTGVPGDADPGRRHAVRLTAVEPGIDPLTGDRIVEIRWCPEDALPFAFCLSARAEAPDCEWRSGISIAFGNVIPVDHGRTILEGLPTVPVAAVDTGCDERCAPAETRYLPGRYRPQLQRPDLSYVAPPASDEERCGSCGGAAASRHGEPDPVAALPAILLKSRRFDGDFDAANRWHPRLDLLDSGPQDLHFVVEMADDGTASLRFGDGVSGRQPAAGEQFGVQYRVGNGTAGNIGAGALRHIVFRNAFPEGAAITGTNPLPACGGTAPEPVADAKLRAPQLFRERIERAVSADDYAAIAMRDFPALVQRAAACRRATGVRSEIQVAIDARHSADPPQSLLDCIAAHLERYRLIGHDLRVVPARTVPIDLKLRICVAPGHIAEQVATELREAFGTGLDRAGRPGFFNPDSLSFGEGIMLSRIVAAAHRVEGVAHVAVERLERLFEGPNGEIESGILPLGPLEVARLDRDPDAPEHGRLELAMETGR